jgi:hypothetical protein
MLSRKTELVLGAILLVLSLIVALAWIPLDSETGMIETFRRQTTMGDAFLPTVAAVLMAFCAGVHLFMNFRQPDNLGTKYPAIDGKGLAFLLQLTGITALSVALFYWGGANSGKPICAGRGGRGRNLPPDAQYLPL